MPTTEVSPGAAASAGAPSSRTMMLRLTSTTTLAEAAISPLEIGSTDNGCPRTAEDETGWIRSRHKATR